MSLTSTNKKEKNKNLREWVRATAPGEQNRDTEKGEKLRLIRGLATGEEVRARLLYSLGDKLCGTAKRNLGATLDNALLFTPDQAMLSCILKVVQRRYCCTGHYGEHCWPQPLSPAGCWEKQDVMLFGAHHW